MNIDGLTFSEREQLGNRKMAALETLVRLTGKLNRQEACVGFYVINRTFNAASRGVDLLSISFKELAAYSREFFRGEFELTYREIARAITNLEHMRVLELHDFIEETSEFNDSPVIVIGVNNLTKASLRI